MTRNRRVAYHEIATREYSAVTWMLKQLPPTCGFGAARLLYPLVAMRDHLEFELEVNAHETQHDADS